MCLGTGDISFIKTVFGNVNVIFGLADFGKGNIDFTLTKFNKGTLLFDNSSFSNGIMNFSGASLNEVSISFLESIADIVRFPYKQFATHNDLRFKSLNVLEMENCIYEKTIKIAGHPQILSLKDTVNLGQIHFSDEPSVIVFAIENSFKEDKGLTDKQKLDQLTLIKENYHQLGEYDGEDLAYRTYMKYKTRFMKPCITKFFYKLFGEIGSYGTKPGNIIMWMFISWLSFAGIFFALLRDQISPMLDRLSHALYFSGITFLTIGYGDIKPLCDSARFLSVAEGFIGLFLMSYLTVAVVRKLLR